MPDVFANPANPLPAHFARRGGVIIADTATHTGPFYALQVIEEAVIASATLRAGWTGAAALAGVTLSAGSVLILPIDTLTLASGIVAAAKQ